MGGSQTRLKVTLKGSAFYGLSFMLNVLNFNAMYLPLKKVCQYLDLCMLLFNPCLFKYTVQDYNCLLEVELWRRCTWKATTTKWLTTWPQSGCPVTANAVLECAVMTRAEISVHRSLSDRERWPVTDDWVKTTSKSEQLYRKQESGKPHPFFNFSFSLQCIQLHTKWQPRNASASYCEPGLTI